MKVSIITPCFNAADKIGRCLSSLRDIQFNPGHYEVIFVDDCSTDGTYELLVEECKKNPQWRALRLEKNSGSPSAPRNRGIHEARGDYVYFLDCDDEIMPSALHDLCALAENTNACLIRSELLADDGAGRKLMNSLPEWSNDLSLQQRRQMIIAKQSTTIDSFIRTALLRKFCIQWPEHLRMGEDTVFLAKVLSVAEHIEYLPKPSYVYYKLPSLTPASTQRYGRRELRDHLEVWETANQHLKAVGVDYIGTRLHIGLRVALESLIFRNRGDLDETTFRNFSRFVRSHWSLVQRFSYISRLKDILQTINDDDFSEFMRRARPRLLIAGHDLKFITEVIPELEVFFDVRVDEWKGHEIHDEVLSRKHLEWAEYIWCEWLLGNAEWYSKNKKPNQRLVIRMHRMELGRQHGERLNVDAVDAVVVVSALFFERLLERFPSIPRSAVRLIPNYAKIEQYRKSWHDDRLFTLGMIGILPSRKGLKAALKILKILRRHDSRFCLKIFSKRPEEFSWLKRDVKEMAYFEDCSAFIDANGLTESVEFLGHVDIKAALEEERVGYVLSVSDSDFGFPGPESFHLAIADGFLGGGAALVLHWEGAEFIWPQEIIFQDAESIASKILMLSQSHGDFLAYASKPLGFIKSKYHVGGFVNSVREIYFEIIK